jgi:hypothetical protein
MIRYFPLLLALILALACGRSKVTESGTETPSATPGWKDVKVAGIQLSVPNEWKLIDLTRADFEKMMDQAWGSDPNAAKMTEMVKQAARSGMVKFLMMMPNVATSDFVPNLNLVVTPGQGMDLDKALEFNKQQMEQMAVKDSVIAIKRTFPFGEGGRLRSKLEGQVPYVAVSYIFPHGSDHYTFTFSMLEQDEVELDKVAMQSLQTLKFTD